MKYMEMIEADRLSPDRTHLMGHYRMTHDVKKIQPLRSALLSVLLSGPLRTLQLK